MFNRYQNTETGAIVHAMQWDGTEQGFDAIEASADQNDFPHSFDYNDGTFTMDEGAQYVNNNNYVVWTGEIWYAISQKIFEGTNQLIS